MEAKALAPENMADMQAALVYIRHVSQTSVVLPDGPATFQCADRENNRFAVGGGVLGHMIFTRLPAPSCCFGYAPVTRIGVAFVGGVIS